MSRRYWHVYADIEGHGQALVHVGTGSGRAGKIAADLVRFRIATAATIADGGVARCSQPRVAGIGRLVVDALAAHRAGIVE